MRFSITLSLDCFECHKKQMNESGQCLLSEILCDLLIPKYSKLVIIAPKRLSLVMLALPLFSCLLGRRLEAQKVK